MISLINLTICSKEPLRLRSIILYTNFCSVPATISLPGSKTLRIGAGGGPGSKTLVGAAKGGGKAKFGKSMARPKRHHE